MFFLHRSFSFGKGLLPNVHLFLFVFCFLLLSFTEVETPFLRSWSLCCGRGLEAPQALLALGEEASKRVDSGGGELQGLRAGLLKSCSKCSGP